MFRLEIKTSNAAFTDGNATAEIARILSGIAAVIEMSPDVEQTSNVRDINGGTVGMWRYEPEGSS